MSKRKSKQPTWILNDEFGIDRNTYNWILYTRDGTGDTTRWKAISYHPTPALLLIALYRKVELTIPAHHDFVHHLEVAADRAHSLCSEFIERVKSNPILTQKRPCAQPKPNRKKRHE